MNYLNNTIYQQYYYILLPSTNTCILTPTTTHSQPEVNNQINAENKQDFSLIEGKIMVTREDLLQQGYEQTKKAWTEEEDQLLLKLCSDQNTRFDQIAKIIPGRNAKMCYSRFRRLSNQSKQSWTKAENEKLQKLVDSLGQDNWRALALNFPNRNHKQLKDHYENYLRPNLSTKQWSVQQDLMLIDLINSYGLDWKILLRKMHNRSRNQIKNRLFGRILRIHNRKFQRICIQ